MGGDDYPRAPGFAGDNKTALLELAKQLFNVSQACGEMYAPALVRGGLVTLAEQTSACRISGGAAVRPVRRRSHR
jgi:hypothetical protein